MIPVVIKKPRAIQDLTDHFTYIGERNAQAAERFLVAAERAFTQLARFPLMGRRWKSTSLRLARIRSWSIPKFNNYLVFYQPMHNGIEVLHDFHARRNIESILESEEAEE